MCLNRTSPRWKDLHLHQSRSINHKERPSDALFLSICWTTSSLALAPSYTVDTITFFEIASCRRIRCWRRVNPTRGSIGVAEASCRLCGSIDRGDLGDPRHTAILDFAGDVPSSRRFGRLTGGRPGGCSVCHDEDRPGESCQ